MRSILPVLLGLIGLATVAFGQVAEKPTEPPTAEAARAVQAQGRYLATITMDKGGVIQVVLEGAMMPFTTANFKQLADAKYFDGLTFHRRVDDFVIQGGDPEGTGAGGPGYQIKLESNLFLTHKRGAISMARSNDPNSAGSQFFICIGDADFLDGRYACFGWVKSGMDVADKVKVGDKMQSVTIAPYDGKEACPLLVK